MKTSLCTLLAAMALATLIGCGNDNPERRAADLLGTAKTQFENGDYTEALQSIDSLRHTYPKALAARKEALRLYQDIELRLSQQSVGTIDSALQQATNAYEAAQQRLNDLRRIGSVSEEALRTVNQLRAKRDTLQARFDTECAKVRYIRMKQSNSKP